MTRHKFQTLREQYLTDPVVQAHVAEMVQASRVLTGLANLCDDASCGAEATASRPGADAQPAPTIGRDDRIFLATLKEGVEELGGQLEVVAVFPDKRVPLLE